MKALTWVSADVSLSRTRLVDTLFPDGVPQLWCPLLTHYNDAREIDLERMRAHVRHLTRHVNGFLVPGSTGDGWELTKDEFRAVVEFASTAGRDLSAHILIGILRRDTRRMVEGIRETLDLLGLTANVDGRLDTAWSSTAVRGFVVCPPSGAYMTASRIADSLSEILEIGVPIGLYQLPQVTGNEIDPATFAALAERYPNLFLLKDTSGHDVIARSGLCRAGIALVRGAEGDYAKWHVSSGGPYGGFLLSTANCFASQLSAMLALLRAGDQTGARDSSRRVTLLQRHVFDLVAGVRSGNMFTNANKAIDHFFAHGPDSLDLPGPMLHGGVRIDRHLLEAVAAALYRFGLMPQSGYMQEVQCANPCHRPYARHAGRQARPAGV